MTDLMQAQVMELNGSDQWGINDCKTATLQKSSI
jgi:hypothetical protein